MTNTQAKGLLHVKGLINQAKLRLQKLATITEYNDFLSDIDSMWYDLDDVINDYEHRFDDASEKRKKNK